MVKNKNPAMPSRLAQTMKRLLVCGLFSSFSMKCAMDLAEVFVGDVRIDLRRCDVGVTEECLHRTQVGTILE